MASGTKGARILRWPFTLATEEKEGAMLVLLMILVLAFAAPAGADHRFGSFWNMARYGR